MSETIIRAPHVTGYTMIINELLLDTELSSAARGLMTFMLGFKNDWQFSVKYLTNILKEGRDSIKKMLGELEKRGYIRREYKRRSDGAFSTMCYTIHEKPINSENQTQPSNKKEKPKTQKTQKITPTETKPVKKAVTKKPAEKIEEDKKDDPSVLFDPKKFANGKIPKWARNMVKKE